MTRQRTPRRETKRGSVMIEFMLILPMLLFLTLFSLDMGRLVFLKARLSDATYLAARSGAQYGDATLNDNAAKTFQKALGQSGALDGSYNLTLIQSRCSANTGRGAYIIVEGTHTVSLMTPGLGGLLQLAGGGDSDTLDGPFALNTRAVALCQVIQ